ncbi:acyl carrier protein [Burkholderia gladioli]|uniref:acyl carrier protein n=1 Tax=Burkholderia gladioli TaxID=28095 RepID=UPI000CDADAC7|nr:acyl carrier protein [Burkholderia gladioli]POS07568.1 polyketide synthase [Burkholderia gladioli]
MAFMSSLFSKIGFIEEKRSSPPLTEAGIHQWLVERLARQLNVPIAQIDPARSFESYGLDSLVALQVAGDLEKLLEQRLSPALLFEHQNIDDLASYLAAELATGEIKA